MKRFSRHVAAAAVVLATFTSHAAGGPSLSQTVGGVLPGLTGSVPGVLTAVGPLADPVLALAQPALSAVLAPGIPLVMSGLIPVPGKSLGVVSLPALPGLPE